MFIHAHIYVYRHIYIYIYTYIHTSTNKNGILKSTVGAAVAQWLRCCVTNPKVAGSIPAGVIGIFH